MYMYVLFCRNNPNKSNRADVAFENIPFVKAKFASE